MAVSYFSIGMVELLLLSGGSLFGLPPGPRDPALLKCPPADAVLYVEWAERSSGKAGAPGIDGLAADPEVKAFLQSVEQAILTAINEETSGRGGEEEVLGQSLPPLVKSLLNRPGCLYVSFAPPPAPDDPQAFNPLAILAGLKVTLIVNGGDDADGIAKHLSALLEIMPGVSLQKEMQKQPLPLPIPGMKLTLHRHHKKYFILGLGEGAIDSAVTGLSSPRATAPGLAANNRFIAATKQVTVDRTASVAWLDVKNLLDQSAQALGLQGGVVRGVAAMLGADAVDSIVTATGVVEGRIRTKTVITTGGRTDGILALAAGRSITPDDFTLVPADADFVCAVSLNAPKILEAVKQIVGKADRNSLKNFEQLLDQLESEVGVSIDEDVFSAFGNVWIFHDSPAAGGIFITSLVGSLEVKDAKKSQKVFSRLMKILKESLPGDLGGGFLRRGVFLEQKKFLGRTIYYVNIVGDENVPFAPAFCLTEKQMLFAPHPQALKAHLRFLKEGQANFASRIQGGIPFPDEDVLYFSRFDSKAFVRYLYAFAPYVGQVILTNLQRTGVQMDLFSLPSARAILPYVDDSYSTVVRTKNGILFDSQRSLPLPGGISAIFSLPMMFMMGKSTRARVIGIHDPQAPVPVHALPAAGTGSPKAAPVKLRPAGKVPGTTPSSKSYKPISKPGRKKPVTLGSSSGIMSRRGGHSQALTIHRL